MSNLSDEGLAKNLFDYMKLDHKLRKANAIVALGTIDTLNAERASQIYIDGWAPFLIMSGGGGRYSENNPKLDSYIFAEIAEKMGIPRDEIIIEDKSLNTGQNFLYTRNLLNERRVNVNDLIVVHMPSSLRRDEATCKKVWPEVNPIMAYPLVPFEEYHIRGYSGTFTRKQFIEDLVGDVQRLKIYAEKGFAVPVDIPDNIWDNLEELIVRGYDSQVVR
mgnify:CR=1 FL=1